MSSTRKSPEHDLQKTFVTWFRYEYPQYRKLFFAVPNGGKRGQPKKVYSKRSGRMIHVNVSATRLKAEGVEPGVSDLILLLPTREYHGLCIETKAGKGKQSDHQKDFEIAVKKAGYRYEIINNFNDFQSLIKKHIQEFASLNI